MARDRPAPYGQRREFVSVTVARGLSPASVSVTVARGPVPRDRLGYRSAGPLGGFHTRIRAGFPRERSMARDRPASYGIRCGFSMARDRPAPYGQRRFVKLP